jgi:hypothetical protein
VIDWFADAVSCAALLLAGGVAVDNRVRSRRQEARVAQIEEARRAEELRPRFVLEGVPEGAFDDYGFTVRVRSECDRALHISTAKLVNDPAAPSALAGMVSRLGSGYVQEEDIDVAVQPHGAVILELTRRHSLQRTDGTGRIVLQVDEPGTALSWSIVLTVDVPRLSGEAPHVAGGYAQ